MGNRRRSSGRIRNKHGRGTGSTGRPQEEQTQAIEELEKTEAASTIASERLEEAETDLAKVSEAITTTIAEAKKEQENKKPAQKQKDHREQLIANHKPVEKMAGRRMVRPPLPSNNKAYNCPACHDSPAYRRFSVSFENFT